MFEKAKQRRNQRRRQAVEAVPDAIQGVRKLREDGFLFEMEQVFVGTLVGDRREVGELVFGHQNRSSTFERTKMIATAVGLETGRHGGIVGDPVQIAARLRELITQWPDGLPAVYAEIDSRVEAWRSEGVPDEQIRTNLILSPDLLDAHNLSVDNVFRPADGRDR